MFLLVLAYPVRDPIPSNRIKFSKLFLPISIVRWSVDTACVKNVLSRCIKATRI